ncbi:hypothetical protein [Azospira sp. I13]|uniref:hypothetical protein n=1 Tax=Azospira sp. I13 TaxID=1765050 RepID=UPI00191193E1|nr:hypothetical protein [Azospira sp. I13]
MKKTALSLSASTLLLLSGCASITGETTQSMRVETRMADGTEIRDAECELQNEYGAFRVKTPGAVTVRRSGSELQVTCRKEGLADGRATAVSRANGGMWGNILFGGGIGAVIDHNKGTAYTYPQWVQMVFGKLLAFDRRDDQEGQPSLAKEVGSTGPADAAQNAATTPPATDKLAKSEAQK